MKGIQHPEYQLSSSLIIFSSEFVISPQWVGMVSMAAIKPVADTAQLNAIGFDILGPF